MSEQSSGYGISGASERLSMLRGNTPPVAAPFGSKLQGKNLQLVIGIAIILIGIALAISMRGNSSPSVVPNATQTVTEVAAKDTGLLDGEAFVAVSVEVGNFPPSLAPGDVVRIIVTPNGDNGGTVHGLKERTVVQAVQAPGDIGSRFVVTVRASETISRDIAASGPIFLSIIETGVEQ